jgi:predicted RNA-binding Zn ribbon-like protein
MTRVSETALPLLGGALCLDFVNTVDPRLREPREEFLASYEALVGWAAFVGVISAAEAAALASAGKRQGAVAGRVHRRAIAMREALYELLRPQPVRNRLRPSLDILNEELQRAMSHAVLERSGDGVFQLRWPGRAELDRVLWPVAHSAAEILSSAENGRVGECEGDGCGWLFLDTSKAGRRRWCSMAICGNRAKAQRHRARARQGRV